MVIVPMDACISRSAESQILAYCWMATHEGYYPVTMTLSNMISFQLARDCGN